MAAQFSLADRLKRGGVPIIPEAIAVTDGVRSLSYADLISQVTILSAWLRQRNLQVIALHAPNCIDWVLIDLACQQASIKCLPLPDFFSYAQLENCLKQSQTDLVFSNSPELLQQLDQGFLITHDIDSPCAIKVLRIHSAATPKGSNIYPKGTQKITFTSGSTGTPKGVCLSVEHQWQTAKVIANAIDVAQPKHLCLLPLATLLENIAGIYAPLLNGGTIYIANDTARGLSGSTGLEAEAFLTCIASHKPQTLILLPQLLRLLVLASQQGWQAPSTLKFIAVGGAKVAAELLHQAHAAGLPVYEGYGLSECGSVVTLNTPQQVNHGTVGRPLEHAHLDIVDGEIIVSNCLFLGYLDDPESWYPKSLSTGDLGSIVNGYLAVDGRKKNLLISSFGRNISPEWIESEMTYTPMFSHCLIVGDNRPTLTALISVANEVSDQDIEHHLEQVNKTLPDYARVTSWCRIEHEQWSGLMTANGKPKRQIISEVFKSKITAMYQPATFNHNNVQSFQQEAPFS